jgi:mono/diheme cytochrome c family protein
MLKNLILAVLAAVFAAGIGYADQTSNKVVVPAGKTPANNGKQMYASYCASCHGVDGKGSGPVGLSLKQPPADLTGLSRNNGGKFPTGHITAVLQFGAQASAHGTAEMPVWGPVFNKLDESAPHSSLRALRISNLAQYIETLQVK